MWWNPKATPKAPDSFQEFTNKSVYTRPCAHIATVLDSYFTGWNTLPTTSNALNECESHVSFIIETSTCPWGLNGHFSLRVTSLSCSGGPLLMPSHLQPPQYCPREMYLTTFRCMCVWSFQWVLISYLLIHKFFPIQRELALRRYPYSFHRRTGTEFGMLSTWHLLRFPPGDFCKSPLC